MSTSPSAIKHPLLPDDIAAIAILENDFSLLALCEDASLFILRKARNGVPQRVLTTGTLPFCMVTLADGSSLYPTAIHADGDSVKVFFPGGSAVIRLENRDGYFRFTADELNVGDAASFTFVQLPVNITKYVGDMAGLISDDDSGVCLRSLSVGAGFSYTKNNGASIVAVTADTPDKVGLTGHSAALLAALRDDLIPILRRVTMDEDVPLSYNGGAWAQDSPDARGSYLFANFSANLTDDWIDVAERGGFTYIHLHAWWKTLGHYDINSGFYPGGLPQMKEVADKIHAAGLKVGIHTLTACIEPTDSWVTPIPSPYLIPVKTYTLARPLTENDTVMYVNELPIPSHELVWSYSCNGNAFRVGTELIQYTDILRTKPYAFLNCTRGAFGTKPQPHDNGDFADYLQQRYISFYPQPDSPLADQLADCIAHVFKFCNVDMLYFDGSEGMRSRYGIDVMRHKIFRRIQPATCEASNWNHNNWWFHTRLGAWDHPVWFMREFHDEHVKEQITYKTANLLESQMGWWAPRGAVPGHARGHFMDETEYFACKNLSIDSPMSIQGVDASRQPPNGRLPEMLTLIGWYERLRLARYFDEETINAIKPFGRDFRLRPATDGSWSFREAGFLPHKADAAYPESLAWSVKSDADTQPLHARIELLYTTPAHDDKSLIQLADFSKTAFTTDSSDATSLKTDPITDERPALLLTATNAGDAPQDSWAAARISFPHPYTSIGQCQAVGLWVRGDASGAILDIQVTSPRQFSGAISDHLVTLDFTGWRFIHLLFPERDSVKVPQVGLQSRARSMVDTEHIERVSVILRNLPKGTAASAAIGPIMAMPITKSHFTNISLTLNDTTITMPDACSGDYFELEAEDGCALFNERGTLVQRFSPDKYPALNNAVNKLAFSASTDDNNPPRAQIVLKPLGKPFGKQAAAPDWSKLNRDFDMPRSFTKCDGIDNAWLSFIRPVNNPPYLDFSLDINELKPDNDSDSTCAINPTLTVNDTSVTFKLTLKAGDRLICNHDGKWHVTTPDGNTRLTGALPSPLPALITGIANRLSLAFEAIHAKAFLITAKSAKRYDAPYV